LHSRTFFVITGRLLVISVFLFLSACAGLGSKPEAPTVTLAGLDIVKADFFEQRFALDLRLQNPNDFVLPVRGLDYKLTLNGTSFASGVSANTVDVPALGEAVIRVESVTNLFSLYQQIMSLSKSSSDALDYALTGNVRLVNKAIKLPFDKRGAISLQ